MFVVSFTACIGEKEHTFTENVYLINTTENNIVFYFESTFGSDTLISKGLDTSLYSYTKTILVERHFAGSTPNYIPFHTMELFEIYDINDTLAYILDEKNRKYSHQDSIFLDHFDKNFCRILGINQIRKYNVIYDSVIHKIMQKDYTMLEKFPKYYGKK